MGSIRDRRSISRLDIRLVRAACFVRRRTFPIAKMDSDSDRSLQQAASLELENGRAIRGYVFAVSMASMAYMMVVARNLSGDPDLSSLGVVLETFFRGFSFWIATLVAAILPVALADRLARWFRISSIFYYL